MRVKIDTDTAGLARRYHHRIVAGEVRHYYTHPHHPLLSLVVSEKELVELVGRFRFALVDTADGTMAVRHLPNAPSRWEGKQLIQISVKGILFHGRGQRHRTMTLAQLIKKLARTL